MGRWCEIGVKCWLPKASELEVGQITHFHNMDCHAYEKQIAELETKLKQGANYCQELLEKRDRAMGNMKSRIAALESRLARIAALVKPIPVADLVEARTEAPALLAERHRQIRAILEDESNG